MQLVTIKSERLTVSISSLGAEIQSILDEQGRERLWQGDPAFWTGRAPILFPVAGGFNGNAYEWQGKRYEMPKHGFVRRLEWQVEERSDSRAVFLMTEKDPGFPFDYELRAVFAVSGRQLRVEYAVTSRNDAPFWFGVGAHEAYATPGGIEDYEIVFDEAETLAHTALPEEPEYPGQVILGENTRVLPLKYDYFALDALVFLSLKSRGVALKGHGQTIRVEFPDHPALLLWTKPGAPYLCIEPWCNVPDYVNTDPRIDRKPGFLCLEKGQTIARAHTITVE